MKSQGAGANASPRTGPDAGASRARKASSARPPSLIGLDEALAAKLAKLGIRSWFDLVLHLPLRYEDETRLTPIRDARPGMTVQVEGGVADAEIRYRPRRQLVLRVEEGGADLVVRFLNFYPSLTKQLVPGARARFHGEVRPGMLGYEMVHPRVKVLRGETPLPESLTPVYPTTAGLAQHVLRALVERALGSVNLSDTVPEVLRDELGLAGFAPSVLALHHPPPDADAGLLEQRTHPAWTRVKFDELLAQQLSMRVSYERRRGRRAPVLAPRGELTRRLFAALPFQLTAAQHRALAEIRADLAAPHPMQRLLQGDVGSGKTIVAAAAALQAIENGAQVAVMAPTEILAEQHHAKLTAWLAPLGVEVAWFSGAQKKRERTDALVRVAEGRAMLAVGTHALIEDAVAFRNLALAIVDEQHRFGVRERLALRQKGIANRAEPHQLMMSATPIPRTLAMSCYADLDVSVIDELPPGRTPVATKLVAASRREEVIRRVRDACLGGSQAYWVCPLIEESEALQLETALATHAVIRETFPDLETGLVHGRLPARDKAAVMEAFAAGRTQLLVATTVIEVGVDVPNATLMVIEHAERMGLSQMHQLRGRVGRGAKSAACILMYQNPLTELARARLKAIYETRDGFEIARRDLELRGPGELLGARQSGVPMLRFADLVADAALIERARGAAKRMLALEPGLARAHLERWLGARHEFLKA